MKKHFDFLFVILIFLTACKQESKNLKGSFPESKNEKTLSPTETISKIENEKSAQKIDPKKEEKSYPFPPPLLQDSDKTHLTLLLENSDDIRSNGNSYSPEKIQQGDVVQEEPLLRTNVRANTQDEP